MKIGNASGLAEVCKREEGRESGKWKEQEQKDLRVKCRSK